MISRAGNSWPLWAKLVLLALPAAIVAAAGVAASVSLTANVTSSSTDTGVILALLYDVARAIARYAVLIGAPAAVIALVVLLLVGGYGHYPLEEEACREHLPEFLGRLVMGCALFAGIGLICQLILAAKLGGWISL